MSFLKQVGIAALCLNSFNAKALGQNSSGNSTAKDPGHILLIVDGCSKDKILIRTQTEAVADEIDLRRAMNIPAGESLDHDKAVHYLVHETPMQANLETAWRKITGKHKAVDVSDGSGKIYMELARFFGKEGRKLTSPDNKNNGIGFQPKVINIRSTGTPCVAGQEPRVDLDTMNPPAATR